MLGFGRLARRQQRVVRSLHTHWLPAGTQKWQPQPVEDKLPLTIKNPETGGLMQLSHVKSTSATPLLEQTIGSMFDQQVAKRPREQVLRVVHQDVVWSWEELQHKVDCFCLGLIELGYTKGDRLGVWLPNTAEWVVAQFATAKLGLVLVNINPAYRTSELKTALNQVGVKGIIVAPSHLKSDYHAMLRQLVPEMERSAPGSCGWHSEALPSLQHIINIGDTPQRGMLQFDDLYIEAAGTKQTLAAVEGELSPNDPVNIQFTSGTTGLPKGATLSHRNILNNGFFVGERMKLTPVDRLCLPVPLYHCFGLVLGNLAAITHGAGLSYPCAHFDPQAVLQCVKDDQCTALHGVPTMFIAMLNLPNFGEYDLSTLRTGIMAGSPCPAEIMRRVMDDMHMRDVTIAYGMTETSPVSFMSEVDDPVDKRVGTVGRTLDHCEVRVTDPEGRTTPVGIEGELLTKGYLVMQGYWGDQEKTDECIQDGWMRTGDTAIIDEEGYCSIVGRVKDMIIRGGENVYPREIEEFLYTHDAVEDVQIVGIPDDKFGEEICAWVKVKAESQLTADEIRSFCKEQIAHYKVPRYVIIAEEFPMTITGKVQKYLMREQSADMIAAQLPGADAKAQA